MVQIYFWWGVGDKKFNKNLGRCYLFRLNKHGSTYNTCYYCSTSSCMKNHICLVRCNHDWKYWLSNLFHKYFIYKIQIDGQLRWWCTSHSVVVHWLDLAVAYTPPFLPSKVRFWEFEWYYISPPWGSGQRSGRTHQGRRRGSTPAAQGWEKPAERQTVASQTYKKLNVYHPDKKLFQN